MRPSSVVTLRTWTNYAPSWTIPDADQNSAGFGAVTIALSIVREIGFGAWDSINVVVVVREKNR